MTKEIVKNIYNIHTKLWINLNFGNIKKLLKKNICKYQRLVQKITVI